MISQQSSDSGSVAAAPRNVSVNKGHITISVTEDDEGEVRIEGIGLSVLLDTGKRQVLSEALCHWKYGIVPCE